MYNAVLSVDLNELDYLSTEIVTDNTPMLAGKKDNIAEQIFGITTNPLTGEIMLNSTGSNNIFNNLPNEEESLDINQEIDNLINQEIKQSKDVIAQIRKGSNTKLPDSKLKELYEDMTSDGMIIF